MAGLDPLIPHIYHEKQQPGSMLCAQHALNSLLQGHYFTAPDLSDLARSLDDLEESYDDSNMGHTSTNMDDTGFFSVQVLDNALKVWGLNLTRWRGEDMRPHHNRPHTQLAFILNLEQHWFTLRRFGEAKANVNLDDGNGHWFNLNSFLSIPEWVGKLYLGMVLQQAEAEGYSVFAVTQADPEAPLALPRTEADMIASTLPEPSASSTPSTRFGGLRSSSLAPAINAKHEGFEDEDYELQAALQASLMGPAHREETSSGSSSATPSVPPTISPIWSPSPELSLTGHAESSGSQSPEPPRRRIPTISLPGHADLDPVAASMERNRVLLQRMREQQEFAQREMWSETDLMPEEQTALNERRERRRREEEEEEAELRRAIEESEALANQQLLQRTNDEDTNMDDGTSLATTGEATHYDDEDAELQAALKASLEVRNQPASSSKADDVESVTSDTPSTDIAADEGVEAPSLEEIRRRRLARFGM